MAITGDYICPRCGFILYKRLLRALDGAIGISVTQHNVPDPGELCPNDNEPLILQKVS